MSPVRRSNSSSSATSASRRLRSRMRGLLAVGSFHIAGSASLVSMFVSSLRMRAGSKILPQVADLIAHGSISEFEIVQRHDLLLRPDFDLNFGATAEPCAHAIIPKASMAQHQAKRSPCAV